MNPQILSKLSTRMQKLAGINYVVESLKKDGHIYNVEEVGESDALNRGGIPMNKAYVGKDGILGQDSTYISWPDIKRLMKKYVR